MFSIGDIDRAVLLAPMEDVTDVSYRVLCRELGADVVYTEFVNADGLIRDCLQARRKLELLDEERPAGIQIYGNSIESMVEAAQIASEHRPDILDINAGCWVKKVSRRGAGAGLLREPDHFYRLVKAVVDAVDLPVTVKTRIGWDDQSINIVEVSRLIEDAGARALTVHCRTRSQGHRDSADWTWIDRVKAVVDIPVILNGDVNTGEAVRRAFAETRADGVMIARGAIGCPWIFREAKEILRYGKIMTKNNVHERVAICLRHLDRHIAYRGKRRAIPSFRKYYSGYLKGISNAVSIRKKLVLLDDERSIRDVLLKFAEQTEQSLPAAS